MNHLSVGLFSKLNKVPFKVCDTLPAHENVIKPILRSALECIVYGLKEDSILLQKYKSILIKHKGKHKLDLSQEVITGCEELWNSTNWARGSVVIITNPNTIDFTRIFPFCYRPGIIDNPNTGNTVSAVKLCKEKSQEGLICICFPASNGIEWMQIYADDEQLAQLYGLANELCLERDYWKNMMKR